MGGVGGGGGGRGLGPLVLKKMFVGGGPGSQIDLALVNVFGKRFSRGHEHSRNLMIERVFSNLLFV